VSATAAQHPHLTVVPDQPAAPLEGIAVEKTAAIEKAARPSWMGAVVNHAKVNRGYAPLAGRGYLRTAIWWLDRYHDDWPLLIDTVRAEFRAAPTSDMKASLKEDVRKHRADYRRHRLIWAGGTSLSALPVATGATIGALSGSLWIDMVLGAAAYGYGIYRGVQPNRAALTVAPVAGAQLAPTPEAIAPLDEEELRTALRAAGFTHPINVVSSTPMAADGTRTVTFDLGGATTVTELRKKTEGIAAALGRDVTMVDITKAAHAGQASLWTANTDPFETPRPSPLLSVEAGPIDSFKDGLPVAYGKRWNTIRLPLTNQNGIAGGGTRSGKGVAASNVAVGASMDPLVNLRIVAGKHNGEWDPYAKTGVASTYFKPNPERLLALLRALLADKDRRERELGKHGKSKMIPSLIKQIGGIELLIIDEVATYTRPGKPLRDEILEALIELSAVSTGAGILMILITQYPEVDVIPQALSINCKLKWAMPVESARQSNTILGEGQSGAGRDASKFDPPRPGLGWLVNPFAGITDLARSFDLDEDERGEITLLLNRAAGFRRSAGRLAGQWDDPIEQYLLNATNLSSLAGGPKNDGVPGRSITQLTGEQRLQLDAIGGALTAMDQLGRDEAQTDEMAEIIGGNMTGDGLGALLRAGGAGGTVKVTVPHKEGRVNGYRRADLDEALSFLLGA
jgi:S-DNA-T family DNA segregation ATPase FtsK/SpoIIIE